jgi:uncharacterized protein (TIRG00374 family)
LLIFLLVALSLSASYRPGEFQRLLLALRRTPLWVVPALLCLSWTNYVLRILRWRILLAGLRAKVSGRDAALSYLAGFAMLATPGRVGELVRVWILKRLADVPYASTVSALLADRLLDVAAVAALCLFGMRAAVRRDLVIVAVGILALVLALAWHRTDRLAVWLHRLLRSARFARRPAARMRLAVRAFKPTFRWKDIGFLLVLSAVGWLAEGLELFVLLSSFGATMTLPGALSIFAASLLLGSLAMLPGGIGSTEILMFGMLRQAGVSGDVSLIATVAVRLCTFWLALATGMLVMPFVVRAEKAALRRRGTTAM